MTYIYYIVSPGRNHTTQLTLYSLKLVEFTIQVLDIFDIAEGKLNIIIGGKVIYWVHDSPRVRRVVQAKSMAKFMDCHSKQVES